MSLFVSFTLTPMLCSRFLKLDPGEAGHAKSKSGLIYRLIDGGYGVALRRALRFKALVVLLTVFVVLCPTFPVIGAGSGAAALKVALRAVGRCSAPACR